MRLLDTDVLVDAVRGYPVALSWVNSLPDEPCLAGMAMMELVEGCANKAELWRTKNCWPVMSFTGRPRWTARMHWGSYPNCILATV